MTGWVGQDTHSGPGHALLCPSPRVTHKSAARATRDSLRPRTKTAKTGHPTSSVPVLLLSLFRHGIPFGSRLSLCFSAMGPGSARVLCSSPDLAHPVTLCGGSHVPRQPISVHAVSGGSLIFGRAPTKQFQSLRRYCSRSRLLSHPRYHSSRSSTGHPT